MRRCVLAALLGLTPLFAAEASAQLRVEWAPGSRCVGPRALERRVESLLSASPRRSWRALVEVERASDRLVARLSLRAGSHQELRALSDPRCEPLVEALAAIVALSIDAVEREADAARAPVQTRPPPHRPARDRAPPSPAASSPPLRGPPVRLAAGLGVRAMTAAMPGPTPGVDLWGRLSWDALRVAVRISVYPHVSERLANDDERGGRFFGAELAALVCAAGELAAFELGLCGQVAAGLVEAEGFGVDRPARAIGPVFSLGPAAIVTWWPEEIVGVGLDLGVSFSPVAARYHLVDLGEVHVSGDPELRGGLSLWLRPIP